MSKKSSNTAIFAEISALYGQKSFNLPELQEQLKSRSIDIPERTLRRWLAAWVDEGRLSKTGKKRGTRYAVVTDSRSSVENAIGFLSRVPPAKRSVVISQLRDLWTHSSTAIEGNTLSLGDTHSVLELGLTISGKPLREHHEVVGHAKAIDLIYQMHSAELTREHVFALHEAVQTDVLFSISKSDIYQPIGAWKREPNFANSINMAGEQIMIEYAKPDQVGLLMQLLMNEVNGWDISSISLDNAHEAYAKIHLAFAHIHPFSDGNGRLARLLANVVLLKAGLPPLIIDRSKRREYIQILAEYQSTLGTPTINKVKESGFWSQPELLNSFTAFCESSYTATLTLLEKAQS